MSSSIDEPRVPLTGADAFLRAVDDEVRRWHGAAHLSQLVLRLGPGFEADALRALVARVAEAAPILRAPVRRPWGVLPPVYRLDRAARAPLPVVEVHAPAPDDGVLPDVFFARLNDRRLDLRLGRLLRFDVVPRGRCADVAMTWAHLLFDGNGSERFVAFLDRCFRGESAPDALARDPGLVDPPPRPFRARAEDARRWQARFRRFAERPPRSLFGPLRRAPQRLRYELVTLDADSTHRAVERARARAGFLTPMLAYLAAAMRAHRAVHRARGSDPGAVFVPLPVNLRPKGAAPTVFRTHVSMMWFQAPPEVMDDENALLESLKAQRREWIKSGLIEAGSAAMDLARFAPARLYSHLSRRDFDGELCSFFFAWTDEFLPECESFLGAPVLNGFHAPPVTPSPGSSVILCQRRGRLNAALVHQEGALTDEERAVLRETLVAELSGAARDDGARATGAA